ncbi:MAG: diguanylate cyclase, partial [Betaproteobacteria bacterium]
MSPTFMSPTTRVLIVDDNEQNLYYLRALLNANGCVVESAKDGAEALAIARREPPELIISDLLMPVMDGYTLLRHWKADLRLQQIPFIVYTATYTEPKDELLAMGLGADAFILKPADPDEFVARLRGVQSNAAAAVPTLARTPIIDESALLKTYNETLVRKLEEKTLQLEVANRALQRDIAERKQTEVRIKYLNRVYAMLSGIHALIVRARHRDELFREACRIAVDDGGFCVSLMGMWDQDTLTFVPVALTGTDPLLVSAINKLLAANAGVPTKMVARVLQEKQAFVSNDSQNDPAVAFREQYAEFGVRSMAVFPLVVANNAVGVLALYAAESAFFHDEERKLLTELTNDIGFAIDHLDRKDRLDYLAYYDSITGLANRSLFLERVAQYMRSTVSGHSKAALFLIDLERFRNINDTLGRAVGDALLRQVAQWLTQYVGDPGLVARVGADQFGLLVPGVNPEVTLTVTVAKMLSAFVN